MNIAYNMDCMEAMRQMPDNAFDLAVVDPPYGDGSSKNRGRHQIRNAGQWVRDPNGRDMGSKVLKKIIAWDIAPEQEYFDELFRVSRDQIIWGGNYFNLPPTRCFLIWQKTNVAEGFSMAMCEYAWCSFNANAKVFEFSAVGQEGRFHPTQKPIELYRWIFKNYAKAGYKILDTHLGSGSSRIAAYDAGLDFVGYEIDQEYFDKQEERFAAYTAQTSLFVDGGDKQLNTQEEF